MKDFSGIFTKSNGGRYWWKTGEKKGEKGKKEKIPAEVQAIQKQGRGTPRLSSGGYPYNPAPAMKQVERLLEQVAPLLKTIRAPALVMQPKAIPGWRLRPRKRYSNTWNPTAGCSISTIMQGMDCPGGMRRWPARYLAPSVNFCCPWRARRVEPGPADGQEYRSGLCMPDISDLYRKQGRR